ncbi:putative reverse transcriptase domain-containing protein, partial [Tanacetum coccineum]
IMPPRRLKKKSIKRLVEKRMAKAIEEYKKTRANPGNASESGSTNTGGTVNVHGYTHKTFMNGKPHPFNGTEGVAGLRRWIDKVEQVFEICKCAEEDKVMFTASTFEGRALTWWDGNVHTLGLSNANSILWNEFKTIMTTEYCPATEIQRMEQELWTLTLKGDDIEAYNNRFHELALMCPDFFGIKGNITSSKPTTLHDAINMARELVEQLQELPQLRIGVILEIYPSATVETHIIMVNALQSVRGAKEPDIERRIVGSNFQVQMLPLYRMWFVLAVVKKGTTRTSVPRQGTNKIRELVQEPTWWLKIHSRI